MSRHHRKLPRRIALLAVATAFMGLVFGAGPMATASSDSPDQKLVRSVRGLVALENGPPGAIAIVNRNGKARAFAAGRANVGAPAPPSSGRSMRVASTAKAFTAATILSLVDSGAVGLDERVGALRPDLPPAWHAATVRQVLQHTAGIPDFTRSQAFIDAFLAAPREPPPPMVLLDFAADRPLEFPSGSRFEYSNSGPIVLGLVIEAVTGRSYEAELAARVTGRLNLRRTFLPEGVAIPAPRISGYSGGGVRPLNVTTDVAWGGWAWASGGIVSTPGNLSGFARGYVGGRLFGRTVRAAQRSFVPGSSEPKGPGRNAAGLGIFRYRTRCGTVFGHTGNITGYTQFFAATADGRRSVAFSINTQVNDELLAPLRRAQVDAVCAALA